MAVAYVILLLSINLYLLPVPSLGFGSVCALLLFFFHALV